MGILKDCLKDSVNLGKFISHKQKLPEYVESRGNNQEFNVARD